ncbi:uncharacterized protein LOC111321353 [Stylophora pistillata]|uniref:Putative diacylglycerol O-acyltransferase Rv1425 n=1 Tax=Stylophora pistillata TaxID=50429 RepID=A0A2B4SQ93_STYPI|nr:uncharacterized protein LOC111321353 [Stylophora pistillata]XP_022779937.1 uncharacterized protein LOC111321353 [Stylophora pistillata]PFX32081.1 putative diacylglycerol O-acyltransferase Rv1425 [Stylophora pistillata]
MCSTADRCWASPRNNQRLNQTSPQEQTTSQSRAHRKNPRLSHPTESAFLGRFILSLLIFIVNLVLFTLFLSVVILVVPVCFFTRKLILYFSIRHYRDGKLSKMSACEAVWLQASCVNTAPMSNVFFLFEGRITIDELENFVKNKLVHQEMLLGNLRLLKLKQSPVPILTGYGWEEVDNLNVNNCVFEFRGNSSLNPEDLKQINEMSNFFGGEKLWRAVLFPKFHGSEDTGVLFQMHESIADMFPFVRIVLNSLDYKTVFLKRQCFFLGRLASYLFASFTGPLVILKRLLMTRQEDFCGTDHERGPHNSADDTFQVYWSGPIDFKSVKRIKDVTRTEVDIILLSCVAGAIRSFLQKSKILYPDDVRVCIRTDVRPQHSRLKLDNKFSMAFIKLPVGTEGAVPRLWETRRRIDNFSFTLESTIMYGFIKLCLLLFPLSVVRSLINYLLNKVSCTVTQIPGPNMPVYMNGKMTKMMTCWTPRKTQNGLSVSITNHSGQIYVGLVTRHSQINDPSLLLADFEREVADLGNHLGKRALPSHLRWRLKVDQQLVNAVNEERERGEREALENELV